MKVPEGLSCGGHFRQQYYADRRVMKHHVKEEDTMA